MNQSEYLLASGGTRSQILDASLADVPSVRLTLNIGMAQPNGVGPDLHPGEVLRTMSQTGFTVGRSEVRHSKSEMTLIVEIFHVTGYAAIQSINALAKLLHQEAIAVRNEATQRGTLVGPKAAAWGPFNPDYFLDFSSV